MKLADFRKKYPEFVYKKYSYKIRGKDLVCSFDYSIKPDLEFTHTVTLKDIDKENFDSFEKSALENLIFHVGLVEMFSYWKTTCSPIVSIKAGYLSGAQIKWWWELFVNGMMQYFYENGIDFAQKDFLKIRSYEVTGPAERAKVATGKILVPVGGGKDSCVTLDLLSNNFKAVSALVVKPVTKQAYDVISASGVAHTINVERELDEKIFDLNSRGYLNGHIPYSAVLYFASLLAAFVSGIGEVVFSNEDSSNEGNVWYLGKEVNHQYSKTLQFENDFRNYNEKFLSNINLFSFLRPLSEIQITKIFSTMEKYFMVIRSCNRGQKEGVWCGKCPKCLSTFVLFLPFMGVETTSKIFGKNLIEDSELVSLLKALIDVNEVKPFECVSTRGELRFALEISVEKFFKNEKLPVLLNYFVKEYGWELSATDSKTYLNSWNENNLPKNYSALLKKYL